MSRQRYGLVALPALALALLALRPGPVSHPPAAPSFGPPWMSVEMPANPLDPATRGAAFVVRTYRHDQPEATPLSGSAEGIVDGERRSVALTFTATGRPGVFAVPQTWPDQGAWVVAVSTGERVHMVIEMGADGGLTPTSYHGHDAHEYSLRSIRVVTGDLPQRDIQRQLTAMAMGQ
jgi:hypothetical protein